MSKITAFQLRQVMSVLFENTPRNEVDFKKLGIEKWILRSGKKAGIKFAAFLNSGGRNGVSFETIEYFTATVDYRKSVAESIESRGGAYPPGHLSHVEDAYRVGLRYGRIPPADNGIKEVKLALVGFDRRIGSAAAAMYELKKRELRPAEIRELLAFAEKYPDIQRKFPVTALSSIGVDESQGPDYRRYFVPYLSETESSGGLINMMGEVEIDNPFDKECFPYEEMQWGLIDRFLAVPEDQ